MLVIFLVNMLKITGVDMHPQFVRHYMKIVAMQSHESIYCDRDHCLLVSLFNMQLSLIFLFLSEYFALLL